MRIDREMTLEAKFITPMDDAGACANTEARGTTNALTVAVLKFAG